MTLVKLTGTELGPANSVLIYEGEWNEEASAERHADEVRYFAMKAGIPDDLVEAFLAEHTITEDDFVVDVREPTP